MTAILALEDGRVFHGESFGAPGTTTGEVCFNTSITGYQEILTDPSYRGQIIAMTYPEIGNYGVNGLDVENNLPQVRGFVIEELSPVVSNWRSDSSLDAYLKKHGIPGIQGIDTRALTRHLRTRGSMRACLTTEITDPAKAVETAKAAAYAGVDFVKEVTSKETHAWDSKNQLSREWVLRRGAEDSRESDEKGNVFEKLPPATHTLAAVDFGMKKNILRSLRRQGFEVTVVPATTSADEILALGTDGVFLSNGPGDPEALDYASETARQLIGKKPLFGICLGHQILARALGGKTFKLKFGHRGANQPVKDLRTGKIAITSQNHGYAVDPASLPADVEVTHINLNDGTVAGLRHSKHQAFSVQYHPEASPGPHDADYFFAEFAKEVAASKSQS
ncbi:MAG: glutamine-hydrolyzing carbamoyl-phosphate synthase small subunit [Verrucomicrobiota bacterium]|jgi:carbamoyl-phosphate synthase small subunit